MSGGRLVGAGHRQERGRPVSGFVWWVGEHRRGGERLVRWRERQWRVPGARGGCFCVHRRTTSEGDLGVALPVGEFDGGFLQKWRWPPAHAAPSTTAAPSQHWPSTQDSQAHKLKQNGVVPKCAKTCWAILLCRRRITSKACLTAGTRGWLNGSLLCGNRTFLTSLATTRGNAPEAEKFFAVSVFQRT